MKRLIIALVLLGTVLSAPAIATDDAPLGARSSIFKVDHIRFTSGILEDLDIDTGIYIGIEEYVLVYPSVYLGGEIGYAKPKGQVGGTDVSVQYLPLEANLKYVTEVAPELKLGLGGGLSYIYIKERVSTGPTILSEDGWLVGGQIFTDINYTSGPYFGGFNFKVQTTEEVGSGANTYDYGNWKLGAQVGMTF